MSERAALLDNAVRFLQDAQVRASGPAKQTAFLESKGLNREEIDEAMRRARVGGGVVDPAAVGAAGSVAGGTAEGLLPPPLPTGPPPVRAVADRFNWGKFALMLAVIGSAGAALSQSVLMAHARDWLAKLRARLFSRDDGVDAEANAEAEAEELVQLKESQVQIKESQEQLAEALGELRQRLSAELDAIKTAQNYLYRELSDELDELRMRASVANEMRDSASVDTVPVDTVPVEMRDITVSNDSKPIQDNIQEPDFAREIACDTACDAACKYEMQKD